MYSILHFPRPGPLVGIHRKNIPDLCVDGEIRITRADPTCLPSPYAPKHPEFSMERIPACLGMRLAPSQLVSHSWIRSRSNRARSVLTKESPIPSKETALAAPPCALHDSTLQTPFGKTTRAATHPGICKGFLRSCSGRRAVQPLCGRGGGGRIHQPPGAKTPEGR